MTRGIGRGIGKFVDWLSRTVPQTDKAVSQWEGRNPNTIQWESQQGGLNYQTANHRRGVASTHYGWGYRLGGNKYIYARNRQLGYVEWQLQHPSNKLPNNLWGTSGRAVAKRWLIRYIAGVLDNRLEEYGDWSIGERNGWWMRQKHYVYRKSLINKLLEGWDHGVDIKTLGDLGVEMGRVSNAPTHETDDSVNFEEDYKQPYIRAQPGYETEEEEEEEGDDENITEDTDEDESDEENAEEQGGKWTS